MAQVHNAENAELLPHCQTKSFRMSFPRGADRIPHMAKRPEMIQDRIQQRLEALRLNPSEAALKGGLNRETIRKLLTNRDQVPQGKTLQKLADALEVSQHWLLTGNDPEEISRTMPNLTGDARAAPVAVPTMHELPYDLPVYGTAAGSHLRGAFIMEGITDYVRRPIALVGAKDAYAIFVEGDSMAPEHRHGSLRVAHPNRPYGPGDTIVVQTMNGPMENMEATIGNYLRKTADHLEIQKLNPPATVRISMSNVRKVHKILTQNELFGI